ncbi:MAG: outer membrane beta-barrel protein [Alphaproteobacteria bacterium]
MTRAYRLNRCILILFALGAGVPLLAGSAPPAHAQLGAIGGQSGPAIEAPPPSGRPSAFDERGREKNALIVGDWLLYPTAFAGAIYDTNPSQSARRSQASGGARLVPALLAERTAAISRTSLYAMTDARLYAIGEGQGFNAVAARLGAIQDYEPVESWVLHAQGDYTRQRDVFSTLGITHGLSSLNPTGVGVVPTQQPFVYNQLTGTGSVLKRFSNAFVSLGGAAVGILYNQPDGTMPPPSGAVYTATGRGGIWLTPDLYTFVSGAVDKRDWDTDSLNSSGFRTLVGIGSDQIGLFRGEIHGGYQQQSFDSAAIGTVGSSVYGGRLDYFPYPKLTLRAAADRTIGASLLGTAPATAAGTSSIVTSFLGQVTYAVFPEWEWSGRAGYLRASYTESPRRENAWTAGATLTYSIWRSFGLSLDYQHLALNSNVPDQGFSRDIVTFGISYKY